MCKFLFYTLSTTGCLTEMQYKSIIQKRQVEDEEVLSKERDHKKQV